MSKEEKFNEPQMSNVGRRVWLIKVPKYITNKWEQAPFNMDVGKLHISQTPGQKVEATLSLTPAIANLVPEEKIPTEHILNVSDVTKQTVRVFFKNNAVAETEKHYMEDRNAQKLECRIIANKYCMEPNRKASVPQRRVQVLDKVVQSFKPAKKRKRNVEYRERKEAERKKARDDKNFVMNMLLNALEQHQHYSINDLVKKTKRTIGYLKEIHKELCENKKKNPHKTIRELKNEYRHYKTAEELPSDSDTD